MSAHVTSHSGGPHTSLPHTSFPHVSFPHVGHDFTRTVVDSLVWHAVARTVGRLFAVPVLGTVLTCLTAGVIAVVLATAAHAFLAPRLAARRTRRAATNPASLAPTHAPRG